jgi:hypothetical protein
LADSGRDSLVVIREGLLESFRSRWESDGVPVRIVLVTDSVESEKFLRELTTADAQPGSGLRA